MTKRLRLALLAALLAASATARADTVQASATTLLLGRQDYRDGTLQTAVPLYQLLNITASDVQTPWTSDLELALSTWGSADLADVRFWQNGAQIDSHFTGDVNTAYIRAAWLKNAIQLRGGRMIVAEGIARNVQLDGGELRLQLPANFGAQAYVGAPVAPRFSRRGGELAVGNIRATLATGGRVFWRLPGWLEVGASTSFAWDHDSVRNQDDPARQDVGADLRLTPVRNVALVGSGWYSLYEQRVGEAIAGLELSPARHFDVTLDYRHVEPDLFLSRNSILAAFVSDHRNDVGGLVHWTGIRGLSVDLIYHAMLEEGGTGHWGQLKGTFHPGGPDSTVGAEVAYIRNADVNASINGNAYTLTRLFGAKSWRELLATLDLDGYWYEREVNGISKSLSATGTLGYMFARGWRAAVAGTAGSTPFMERQFEIMAKLVYEQTYATREAK
jgi:hypothetical protein